MPDLESASREELLEIIAALVAKEERLMARVAELEEEIRKLRGGKGTPLVVKWLGEAATAALRA